MHRLGQIKAVLLIENVGYPAFPGLRIDPDDRFVTPTNIMGVDGQIRHAPIPGLFFFPPIETFLNRILMTSRESREHQLPGIRLTIRNGHAGGPLVHFAHP